MKKVGRKANPSPYEFTENRHAGSGTFSVAVHPEPPTALPRLSPDNRLRCALRREITPDYLSRHALSAASISLSLMERSRE
jgi:hypothetical protein